MEKQLGVVVWYCDTYNDLKDVIFELDSNPDFNFLGEYDLIKEIVDEFEYQGISSDEFIKMTNNRYGNCIEILEYSNRYTVYYGVR